MNVSGFFNLNCIDVEVGGRMGAKCEAEFRSRSSADQNEAFYVLRSQEQACCCLKKYRSICNLSF